MRHRVRLDMSFNSEADALQLMNLAKTLIAKSTNLVKAISSEVSYCEAENCYHDEVPVKPCEIIERVEATNIISPKPIKAVKL